MTIEDRYLGDGVYASFDGYYIDLDLRGQNDHTCISLDPAVMNALIRYHSEAYTGVPPFPEASHGGYIQKSHIRSRLIAAGYTKEEALVIADKILFHPTPDKPEEE